MTKEQMREINEKSGKIMSDYNNRKSQKFIAEKYDIPDIIVRGVTQANGIHYGIANEGRPGMIPYEKLSFLLEYDF